MATDKELKAKLSWKARSMAISAIDIAEGIGIDTDGDGAVDAEDDCPETAQGEDVDGDGCADYQLDSDNDGVTDDLDACPNPPREELVNQLFTLVLKRVETEFMVPVWLQLNLTKILRKKNLLFKWETLLQKNFCWKLA